jgi:transposase
MEDLDITAVHAGASGFIAGVCRKLRIAEMFNRSVEWDETQWKVSPGTRAVALIINMLVQRMPLYRVWESFTHLDLPVLFDEPVELDDLNDDGFGRTLDRLYASNQQRTLVSSVALRATNLLPLGVRSIHADTTSISLAGAYEPTVTDLQFVEENPDRALLQITHGYSKDHRPDLKQFIYGLVVTSEGMPLLGDVRDGNLSDKVWNQEILNEIESSFLVPQHVVYVADSALVTADNLEQMAKQKIRFISRLPEVYGLAKTLKEAAWKQKKWENLGQIALTGKGSTYQAQSIVETLEDHSYRFVVIHSSALEKQKLRSLEKAAERELNDIQKAQKNLEKERFSCKDDAQIALDDFLRAHGQIHQLSGAVVPEKTTKRPAGRPKAGAEHPIEIHYRIEINVVPPSDKVKRSRLQTASTFVLITNLDEAEWSNTQVLQEYKGQISVETRFRNIKADPCIVDNIYVKSSRRAEALAYLYLVALIVASFIEVCIRQELKNRKRPFLVPGNRWTERPTMTMIFDIMETVLVMKMRDGTRIKRMLPSNIDPRVYELLELSGLDHTVYTRVLHSG